MDEFIQSSLVHRYRIECILRIWLLSSNSDLVEFEIFSIFTKNLGISSLTLLFTYWSSCTEPRDSVLEFTDREKRNS